MTFNIFDGIEIPKNPPDAALRSSDVKQQFLNKRLKELQNYIKNDHTDYIRDYHNTFDILFRASERVRHHQKFQFREQKKLAQYAFDKELEELEDCRHEEVPIKNTMEFVPKDMEISDIIAPYMQLAIESGKTLMEVIPPTLLAESLHYLSGSSTDNGSSSDNTSDYKSSSNYKSSTSYSSSDPGGFSSATSSHGSDTRIHY